MQLFSLKNTRWLSSFTSNLKHPLVGLFLVVILSAGVCVFGSIQVGAVRSYVNFNPSEEAQSAAFYTGVGACVRWNLKTNNNDGGGFDIVGPRGDVSKWFASGSSGGINNIKTDTYIASPSGQASCAPAMSQALAFWDIDADTLLQAIGYTYDAAKPGYQTNLKPDDIRNRFNDYIIKNVYNNSFSNGQTPTLSDPARYVQALNTFQDQNRSCKASNLGLYSDLDETARARVDQKYRDTKEVGSELQTIQYLSLPIAVTETDNSATPKINTKNYGFTYISYGTTTVEGASISSDTSAIVYGKLDKENLSIKCSELAQQINDYAVSWRDWKISNPNSTDDPNTVVGKGTVCTNSDDSGCNNNTTCAVSSVGWIVCPVMSFLSDLSDKSMSFLEGSFLTTPSSMFVTGDTGNVPLKSAWNTMRSVANVGFIFAFLFIIFSQLTGYGVSNYGVKKMLPRLIVAAILVNLSFYLCALMVDISNILGHTLHTIFNDLNKGLKTTLNQAGNTGWGVGAIVLGLLAGGTSLALAISIPVVISALIAVLATVLALAGRTALIVLLIVISPLAFIAYILPNTEQWFKKWLKMLWTLLLLFPIISIVFGVSKFASSIVYTIGAESDSNISGLVAIAVAALPLFVVPGLLKNALSAAGSIGTKFANLRDRFNKNATSKAANSGVVKSLERRKQLRRARVGAGVYSGWNPVSRLASSANKKLNSNKAFNTLTGDYGTTRGGMIGKLEEEESKTAEAAVVLKARDGNSYQAQLTAAINSGDAVTAKASQSMLVKSGGPGISAVRDIVKTFTADPSRLSADSKKALSSMSTDIMETHGAAVNESAPDLLAWSKDTNNNNSIENLGAITAKPGTWNNKSARQLAKLPDAVFADAINSGGIHSEARKNLNKREIQADLTPAKKELLDNSAAAAAAAAATAAAAAATGATPGGGTGAPGNTGPAGGPAPGGPAPGGPAPSGPAPSGPTPPAVPGPANGPAPGSPPSNL